VSASPRVAAAGHLFGKRRTVFAAVPIACVRPNPLQPRQYFDPESLSELADSIRARGLLQPIIVRRGPDGEYTLVAGERRLRAAELAGVGLVPAILSDDDLLEVALEENVQREDLSPLEEAEALAALAQERGHSHAELAQVIHKSRPYVSNTLTLTRLPADVKQEYFRDGRGVSREILINIARQENADAMRALWKRVRLQSMSVRSFRSAEAETRPDNSAQVAIRAARRLGRALQALSPAETLAAEDVASLRRTLERAQRRIAAALAALPGGTATQAPRSGRKRAAAIAAGAAAGRTD
jgi:ParB family chromosome partitioning protein